MASKGSDKKIFYGLVILIVLTILLIIGITYIQRPQTTGSDASTPDGNLVTNLDESPAADPTSVPLRGGDSSQEPLTSYQEQNAEQGGTTNTETTTEPGSTTTTTDTTTTTPDTTTTTDTSTPGTTTTTTTTPESSRTTTETTTTEQTTILETGTSNTESTSASEPSSTVVADTTGSTQESTSGSLESSTSEPTPTETILADAGYGGGSSAPIGSTSNGVPVIETSDTYTTSTPVPTTTEKLPTAGIANVTLLVFAASLMLVVLGLAL